jgi:hypothetical protein
MTIYKDEMVRPMTATEALEQNLRPSGGIEIYSVIVGRLGLTPVMIANNFEAADLIFMSGFNVIVLCIDLPRSWIASSSYDAKRFFDGGTP